MSLSRRSVRAGLGIGLSVVLLAAVLWRADPSKLRHALEAIQPGWFVAALAVNLAATWVMAVRWWVLLVARGRRDVPVGWLFETYLVALLAGQVLPTAVGGDAVRIVDLGRRTGSMAEATSSVVVDRVVGSAAVVVLAAAGALAGGGGLGTGAVAALEIGLALATAAVAFLLFSRRARVFLRPVVPVARGLRVEAPARSLYHAMHAYRNHAGALGWVFVLGLVAQLLRVAVIGLLAHGMGLHIGVATLLLLGPMLFLVTMVPVSLNGLGLREATFVVVLGGVGVAREDAFVLGLAFFAVGVLTALLGGVVLLRRSLVAHTA